MPYAARTNVCVQCKKPFRTSPHGPSARYCSPRCRGDARMGENHPLYKGGKTLNKRTGYVSICIQGRTMMEHRYVMEQQLGRRLETWEQVHHKDGNKSNNAPDNLELMPSPRAHAQIHCELFRSDTDKQCSSCLEVKPRDQFCKKTKGYDPHQSECKACNSKKRLVKAGRDYLKTPPKGEESVTAKVTEADVLFIRKLHSEGVSTKMIAKVFKIHVTTAYHIWSRKSWKHVP